MVDESVLFSLYFDHEQVENEQHSRLKWKVRASRFGVAMLSESSYLQAGFYIFEGFLVDV